MIEAFHSNWTAPFFILNPDKQYFIEDFEILTTILSALKWRQHNGSIKMVTDKVGIEYYKKLGMQPIWDLGIDNILDYEMYNIDPFLFWAAGKIIALKKQDVPIVMIDTDFIVWEKISNKIKDLELCTIHNEAIYDDIYPDKSKFYVNEAYKFDEGWDWEAKPYNTAFTFISNYEFKQYYTKEAIKFMKSVVCGFDRVTNMVFAEQRLISMCAAKLNIKSGNLYSLQDLSTTNQTCFTHIWGYKDIIKNDFSLRNNFCIRCIKRIIADFPEYENMISNIEPIYNYYIQYKRSIL